MKHLTDCDKWKEEEKTILSEAREVANHRIACINKKQWRQILIVPIFRADKRTGRFSCVSVPTVRNVRR